MNDTKQPVSEKSPEYLAATLREVAETLTDVGKTIDARLAAWAAPETPEPEPPSVNFDGEWFTQIGQMTTWPDGGVTIYGQTHSGRDWALVPDTTQFAIWQECVRKGVPCPEPPTIALLNFYGGPITDVASITEVRRHGNATKIICTHRAQGEWKTNAVCLVAETPAAIRALCDAAGVPCPEEEKPRGIDIVHGAGTMRLDQLTSITAKFTLANKPGLFVTGTVGATDGATFTTTPIADIRKQAAEAGIELPEVTVNIDSYRWTAIERADCHVCDDGSLLTGIIGVAERYGEHTIHTSTLTPAQVVVLCELAGWPKPEVGMVLTFCDGEPCEVDPADVQNAEYDAAFHATRVQMRNEYMYLAHYVREPVAVVEAMLAACKEGE